MKVTLEKGFKRVINGEEVVSKDVVLKTLSYGEILDVQAKSETLIQTDAGTPMLVVSQTLMAKNSLLAQIKKIGDDYAPFPDSILDTLNEEDGNKLMELSARMEAGALAENVGKD